MGYEGWVGLSRTAMKEKARPYSEAIYDTWIRMKRAMPEMQSSAMPFVKEKWDETAVFLVQDELYQQIDTGKISVNEGVTRLVVAVVGRFPLLGRSDCVLWSRVVTVAKACERCV